MLDISAVSAVIVIIAICDMPKQEFSLHEHVYIHITYMKSRNFFSDEAGFIYMDRYVHKITGITVTEKQSECLRAEMHAYLYVSLSIEIEVKNNLYIRRTFYPYKNYIIRGHFFPHKFNFNSHIVHSI